jgi:hypothetical protein
MKNHIHKQTGIPANTIELKRNPFRSGAKSSANRYERRKIREQLRRLDWALAGVD